MAESCVNSIADLRALNTTGAVCVTVLGYYAPGAGGGLFYWDSTSTAADNGGTIIQPTGVPTGRWKRQYSGAINICWFGAPSDGLTDGALALQAALNMGGDIYVPSGVFLSRTTLTVPSNTHILGGGDASVILSTAPRAVNFAGVSHSSIRCVKIDCDDPAKLGGEGITIERGSSYITVDSNTIIHAAEYGISVQAPAGAIIVSDNFGGIVIKNNLVDMSTLTIPMVDRNLPIGIEVFPRGGNGFLATPGILIDGNTVLGTPGAILAGIKVSAQKGARIVNNYVSDIISNGVNKAEGGIIIGSSVDAVVANNHVVNVWDGISCGGNRGIDNNVPLSNALITNNVIDGFDAVGIFSSEGSNGLMVCGNVIDLGSGSGRFAVQLVVQNTPYSDTVIDGNRCNGCGIASLSSPNATVVNNVIVGAVGTGIDLGGDDNCVRGNIIRRAERHGINISGNRAQVIGNKILDANQGNHDDLTAGVVVGGTSWQVFENHIENLRDGGGVHYGIWYGSHAGLQQRDNRMVRMQTGDIFCALPTLPDIRSQAVYIDSARTACGFSGIEEILKTVTYPRGAFTPFGGVQISCGGHTTGWTINEVTVYFGSNAVIQALFNPISPTGAWTRWFIEGWIFNVGGEGAQRYEMALYHDVTVVTYNGTLAENTATGSVVINVSGLRRDAGNVLECDMFRVEQFR